MSKKVNIIGAGLAGISAGIYLEQKGIKTEIFELAPWAGGQCTTWVRGGYRFDGCIHWMVGTKKGTPFYQLYREVGALDESTVIYNAPSIRLEMQGAMYDIPLDIAGFKALLLKHAKGDEARIEAFIRDIQTMMRSQLPMGSPENLSQALGMLLHSRGFLMLARKYAGMTVKEYLQGFQSETLRQILYRLMPPSFSAVALVMMLGTRMSQNAGYPLGGALEVMGRMVEKYKALGGKIHFNTRVDEIVVENGAAKGIRAKGKFHPADYVIAACDAHDTLKNMLGGKYPHPQLDAMLREAPLFDPLAIVSFGLDKRLNIPFSVMYECPRGIEVAPGVKEHGLHLSAFDFDSDAAPKGGSSAMVMLGAPLDHWQTLRENDPVEYKRQKQALADDVANFLQERIPGFKDAIRVTDVATPATYVRLTNVYRGSYEGFSPTPSAVKGSIKKTVPGLKNLCLCGQWTTAGGGICTAVYDGKSVAGKIAKELK